MKKKKKKVMVFATSYSMNQSRKQLVLELYHNCRVSQAASNCCCNS